MHVLKNAADMNRAHGAIDCRGIDSFRIIRHDSAMRYGSYHVFQTGGGWVNVCGGVALRETGAAKHRLVQTSCPALF